MRPAELTDKAGSARWRKATPFVIAALAAVVAYPLSIVLPGYIVFLAISAVIASIAIMGLGIVTGSAGMIALCQLTFAAIGAWVVAGLNVIGAPGGFALWLVIGAAAAALAGVVIGLPALRLRGVNLAVVTLGFAAAADVTLVQLQFPGSADGIAVERPALFANDQRYFFFSLLVLIACSLIVSLLHRSRLGSSWKAVAYSERGAAAVGQRVDVAKLSAFAISAALGGVAGGLLAGQVQLPFASSFTPLQSLALYVLAVMSGAHLIDMAVFGGILWVLVPELLKRFGVQQDWGFVIFGALGVQALTSGTNLGASIRNLLRRRRRTAETAQTAPEPGVVPHSSAAVTAPHAQEPSTEEPAVSASPAASGRAKPGTPVLDVEGLTVRFGQLTALDKVSFAVEAGTIMGLIGPNGAGKSTFVDAVGGFLPAHEGRVALDGRSLSGLGPTAIARLGLRRTFQQDRVPPTLTVDAYMRFVARRSITNVQIEEMLEFFACPPAASRIADIDVGTRRLVEIAANLAAQPRLMVLDEPAAGLSHEEHLELADRLRQVPGSFGTSLVIIEHDLDLVRAVCDQLTVLNFGQVLASGEHSTVLKNPAVVRAYMGETEVL